MQMMSRPIQPITLAHFARRKGWEQPTLEGVLAYCERQRLVERFKSIKGAAFRLTGESATHGPDEDNNDVAEKEETMAKDEISTGEAAELCGVSTAGIRKWVKQGKLKPRVGGGGRGQTYFFDRGVVLAFKQVREAGKTLAPPQPKARVVKLKAAHERKLPTKINAKHILNKVTDEYCDLREDVIMLVRLVDRGWMSPEQAWGKLRELAESI
jgi:hypothetical protein